MKKIIILIVVTMASSSFAGSLSLVTEGYGAAWYFGCRTAKKEAKEMAKAKLYKSAVAEKCALDLTTMNIDIKCDRDFNPSYNMGEPVCVCESVAIATCNY
jgi:hypothetical protein